MTCGPDTLSSVLHIKSRTIRWLPQSINTNTGLALEPALALAHGTTGARLKHLAPVNDHPNWLHLATESCQAYKAAKAWGLSLFGQDEGGPFSASDHETGLAPRQQTGTEPADMPCLVHMLKAMYRSACSLMIFDQLRLMSLLAENKSHWTCCCCLWLFSFSSSVSSLTLKTSHIQLPQLLQCCLYPCVF